MTVPATKSASQRKKAGSGKSSLNATIRDQTGAGKIRIGQILSKEGYISRAQLDEALAYQKRHNGRLGSILIRLGHIEEETIVNVLGRIHNFPVVEIAKFKKVDPKALRLFDYDTLKQHMAFPLGFKGEDLIITMAEPTDTSAVEALQRISKYSVSVRVSTERDIVDAFKKYLKIDDEEYDRFFDAKEVFGEEEEEEEITGVEDFGSLVSEAAEELEVQSTDIGIDEDEYLASDAPIIKLVNGILIKAIKDGVSDIHIEPFEKVVQVRYRIDGSLYKAMNLPIKILSNLNIAERRIPQDGRIKMRVGKYKAVDFRTSTLPTLFGEGIVMRILDQSALNVDLTKLGFEPQTFEALKRCVHRPYGLLLVTGPTGSGKTTTLYSILNLLNKEDTKILTAEDPVEFNFKGMNQVPVHEEVGMTFSSALKAFLRQDPDIIMVGEIRDLTTAEIAIKAAMTGHLVFSTLHTNDCPSTIGRLIDIGVPSYMLASSVTMVLSQRLARKLCPKCKTTIPLPPESDLATLGFDPEEDDQLELFGPKGCPACTNLGYKGRTGLYELMEVTEEVAKAISAEVPEDQLRKIAISEGMVPLREAALDKARQGVTSLREVVKRTVITKASLPAYLLNPDIEEYHDKDVIIREGNRDIDFFRLVQGACYVVKDGKVIAQIVEPGEIFGEMAVITGSERSASIVAKGRTTIKRFPGDKLLEVIQKYPDVATHLFQTLAGRLANANTTISKLANK